MKPERHMTLVLGGARSGKSRFAENLARRRGERVLFVATARAGDAEMCRRIEAHRRSRPPHWKTVEARTAAARTIAERSGDAEVVLLDCLALLAANILLDETNGQDAPGPESLERIEARLETETAALIDWFRAGSAHLIVVSNEVGMGIVPPYPSGRAYRDLIGFANQRLAAQADEVYWMVAGLPIDLKKLA